MRLSSLTLILTLALPAVAQQHIAPTDAKSPADELKTFKLPPGFTAQLVASEPDIQKPMQCAFDAKGRLWVTTSHSYPFPAAKPHDKLFVLADFGPDGKARKITTFADDLNIPIGILPLADGSALVSEVGRIVKLTDTDGDGKADKREVILSGFGTRDTHGMMNSFTLMPDGWVYACHGYLNESKVTGKDGHTITMQSGHTFRFRPDGSRVEVYTRGQVNPFGMTVDPWGNLYTADCHSKPITQLIPGAHYDSFGKPHDGLGYAPHVTRHDHGSTALCGLQWYDGDKYPAAFRDNFYLGNVVTNRINRDRIEWKGSTPVAVEQADFLVSSDPWFRPTEVKLGPDGALYVTDFYNKIIGHYEVDLKHPQRDKDHGRVWRIVYTGDEKNERRGSPPPKEAHTRMRTLAAQWTLTDAEKGEVRIALANKNPFVVRAAVDAVIAHTDAGFVAPLFTVLASTSAEDTHLIHAARIALRDQLFYPEAWHLAFQAVEGKPSVKAELDHVALGSPTVTASWWLRERNASGALAADLVVLAAAHVARYGDAPRRVLMFADIGEMRVVDQQEAVAIAFRKAVEAAGFTMPQTPFPVQDRIKLGLKDKTDRKVAESLRLATAMKMNVSLTAFDLLKDPTKNDAVRIAALDHLLDVGPRDGVVPTCGDLLKDPATPPKLREKALAVFIQSRRATDLDALQTFLTTLAYQPAVAVAAGLAASPEGSERLLAAVKTGKASPRLLQEKLVLDRLKASKVRNLDARLAELTKGIPSADARLAALVQDRAVGFAVAKPGVEAGKKVYATHCAACHPMGGVGGKIGPNLDGIGTRGRDRLLEDTLDPNRNVDIAFWSTTLDLADGRKLTGLLLRQDGAVYVMADAEGKEVRVPVADVEKRSTSGLSPMPANVGEKLAAKDYYDLLAYLLDQRPK